MKKDGVTPVIHLEGFSDFALGFYLELEKDRFDVRLAQADRSRLVGARGDDRLQKALHLWVGSASNPHRLAKCTEVIAKSGDLVLLGSPSPTATCL